MTCSTQAEATSTLGLVTVGQSPRDDVLPDIQGILSGLRLVEHGALDGLDEPELEALRRDEDPSGVLATRLSDGREIVYPEQEAVRRTQAAVERTVRDHASAVLLLCTGSFPRLQSAVPVLYPDRLLQNVARAVYDQGPVVVMTPAAAQQPSQRRRWMNTLELPSALVHVVPFSPYSPHWRRRLVDVGSTIEDVAPAMVILDCIGYTTRMREAVRTYCPPGSVRLLARTVAARVALEVVHSRD